MDDKLEEIRQLVFKEILGTITVTERERLSVELERDEAVRKMRDEMMGELNTVEVATYLKQNSAEDFAGRVIGEIRMQRKGRVWVKFAVAAVMAGLIAGTVWIYRGTEAAPAIEGVQLVLPGGERVGLENGDKEVRTGGVQISHHKKQMSYQGGTGLNNQMAVLYVPAGKDYTITLSDGTVVQLNAASKLRFPLNFGEQSREIFIEGEAYVEVAKDAKRPFTVHLPGTNVEVLGTAFNVNTYDSKETKIALVEGAVKLVNQQDSILLKPGEIAVADGDITVGRFDAYETLSWREGKFVLNNVKMEEVCRIIPRWFGVGIEMDNAGVGEKRFSGVIDRNKEVEELLKGLKATNGIDYYWKERVVHIR